MRRFIALVLSQLVLAIYSASSFGAVPIGVDGKWMVSIPELLAKPEMFEGKRVIMSGFLRDTAGHDRLYLTREYALINDRSNSIELEGLSPEIVYHNSKCDSQIAKVHGTIKKIKEEGRYPRWVISDIEVIYVYSDLNDATGSKSAVCWGRKQKR